MTGSSSSSSSSGIKGPWSQLGTTAACIGVLTIHVVSYEPQVKCSWRREITDIEEWGVIQLLTEDTAHEIGEAGVSFGPGWPGS
jgi:hypothetical protein